jgi:hypothetical protein
VTPSLTPVESIAIAIQVPSALVSYQKAPLVSLAFLLSFTANVAYTNGIATDESIRWISAIVGLAGAFEFGRGVERLRRVRVSIPDVLRAVDGGTWIGVVVLASMGVDGFGMLVYRWTEIWAVPEMTIGILILVVLIGLFGKEG